MMRVDKCADQNERMNRSGGEMIMAGNDTKIMQDKTAASIICSKCGMIIVPAQKIHAFRERTIREFVKQHQCPDENDKNILF